MEKQSVSSSSENIHCGPNELKRVQKNLFDVLADCFCPYHANEHTMQCSKHRYCAGANEACLVLLTESKGLAVRDNKCGLSNKLVFRCTCGANSLTLICLQVVLGIVNLRDMLHTCRQPTCAAAAAYCTDSSLKIAFKCQQLLLHCKHLHKVCIL